MTANELLEQYEHSGSTVPAFFGIPISQLSPKERAGELIKRYGLEAARRIAQERANEFPAGWNDWQRVAEVLFSANE